jgi:sortase A
MCIRDRAKAALAQVLIERAFEKSPTETARPWPWADIEPVARIEAPRLNRTAFALTGVSGEALAFGPGHMTNTSLPGMAGTSVFAAHRDTHFSWIGALRPGDQINISTRDGQEFTYRMTRAWIAPFDQPGIDTSDNRSLLALVTCWPLDGTQSGPERYIVEAELVAEKTQISLASPPHSDMQANKAR